MDVRSLVEAVEAGQRFDYVFFWQPDPKQDPPGTEVFSQWYPSRFEVDGVVYRTAEHWMMAGKARLFGDDATLARILAAPTPREAKALGRKVRGFDQGLWMTHRDAIVREGSLAKYRAHDGMRRLLLDTGDAVLAEASPLDAIWGIGLAADHPDARDPRGWPGLNLLGFVLMEVRACLS
ncbi:MAG: NADAR family protein [Myxococcales bacterium]|nr:NADAR family protein [Myxococcales bacterium]